MADLQVRQLPRVTVTDPNDLILLQRASDLQTSKISIADVGIGTPPPGSGLPTGGTNGQIIVKTGAGQGDQDWVDAPPRLPDTVVADADKFVKVDAGGTGYAYVTIDLVDDLDDLNSTNLNSVADGDVLTYDNATSKWINKAIPFDHAIDELNDVELATPAKDEVLTFDDTTNKWKNKAIPKELPARTGADAGKFLMTDGTTVAWQSLTSLTYKGSWTPVAGHEYPDASTPHTGDLYVIDGGDFTFTYGNLTGKTVSTRDAVIFDGTFWAIFGEVAAVTPITTVKELTDTNVNGVTDGQIMIWDDTSKLWAAKDIPKILPAYTAPDAEKILAINKAGTGYEWIAQPAIPNNLDDFTDVNITTPAGGEILIYDNTSKTWMNKAIPDQFPTVATGDAGKYIVVNAGENGYELQTLTLPTHTLEALTDTNITPGATIDGYMLKYDDTAKKWVTGPIPKELPAYTAADKGKILTVNAAGTAMEWDAPATISLDDLDDLDVGSPADKEVLTWNNGNGKWESTAIPKELPTQTGQAGKFLSTNGTSPRWLSISAVTYKGVFAPSAAKEYPSSPSSGDLYIIGGSDYVFTGGSLVGTKVSARDGIIYDGTRWDLFGEVASSKPTTTLSGMTDTNIKSPATNQILTYVGGKWTNRTPASSLPGVNISKKDFILSVNAAGTGYTLIAKVPRATLAEKIAVASSSGTASKVPLIFNSAGSLKSTGTSGSQELAMQPSTGTFYAHILYEGNTALSNKYAPKIHSHGNYITTAAADAKYQLKGSYLTTTTGDARYQRKGSYLTSPALSTSSSQFAMTAYSGGKLYYSSRGPKMQPRTGKLYAPDFALSSDVRQKKVIDKIGRSKSGIEFISFKAENDDFHALRYGVSAQQVAKIKPELVNEFDGQLTVNYIDLLIDEVARLNEKIAQLENK